MGSACCQPVPDNYYQRFRDGAERTVDPVRRQGYGECILDFCTQHCSEPELLMPEEDPYTKAKSLKTQPSRRLTSTRKAAKDDSTPKTVANEGTKRFSMDAHLGPAAAAKYASMSPATQYSVSTKASTKSNLQMLNTTTATPHSKIFE
ncbi:unnamed protein product [Vitrella brassicaformis CCMP3155]|uniref:Uncharacterized protein n=2 Tax=Vitrella brassicaformis TaxID=1169539 RepID=A0A0G4GGA8_VITBC|nr:unnamed protein product [Vitrella brassicaformis CCMP3155]|mmetsp:Transcript_40138/g.100458  ORF Transcript_40138/g.100458 Transcript_40138/m.100458 type:complete len:148 (+) Transcript_40138:239-682(+)|eukprot:CEM28395.1 unnamed protein product [Vitrella brassicaformis CCMP3155]